MSSSNTEKPSEETSEKNMNCSRHVSMHDKVNNPTMDDSTSSFGDSFAAGDDEDLVGDSKDDSSGDKEDPKG